MSNLAQVTPDAPAQAAPVVTEIQLQARKKRNKVIGICLLAYVILMFVVTVTRLGGGSLYSGL